MKRFVVDPGKAIGDVLSSSGAYSTWPVSAHGGQGLPPCDEVVIVATGADETTRQNVLLPLIEAGAEKAKRLVLLSSLDVYPTRGLPLDERYVDPCAPRTGLGRLESAVAERLRRGMVLRLPDVFGPSIAAGPAAALLDRDASGLNRVAIHQWYPVRRLRRDIARALRLDVRVVNLATEPLPMADVLMQFFPGQMGQVRSPAPYSRIRTRYAAAFGGAGDYIMTASDVLAEMRACVLAHRREKAAAAPSRRVEGGEGASASLA
ncbi:hypothetical protein JDN40_06280 [Rhodomicrobium vannielii ATCC 17100]|uniref:hypothetical protein n=1 Tax=Rhodomicrobium vannielii TaxID=1069 RepID=UPI00191A96D0|nr:hypothetical protein [Rhodomicrobium vannielii]MBJ7533706.1 hypothetical protein [Rhodomicrobium vannielii ATCC 17100]